MAMAGGESDSGSSRAPPGRSSSPQLEGQLERRFPLSKRITERPVRARAVVEDFVTAQRHSVTCPRQFEVDAAGNVYPIVDAKTLDSRRRCPRAAGLQAAGGEEGLRIGSQNKSKGRPEHGTARTSGGRAYRTAAATIRG